MSLFKKKSSGFDEAKEQGAAKSSGSLIVLLVLVGGFAYLYFFTSLIVPHEKPVAVNAPVAATEVKQSMPPKPADLPSAQPAVDAGKPGEAKPAAAPAPPPGQPAPAPSPAAAKAASPLPATTAAKPGATAPLPKEAKPAAAAAAPQAQPAAKPAAVPAPAASKSAIAPQKKADSQPAKAVQSKPADSPRKMAEAKSVKAPASPAKKPAATKKPETYTVFAGEFPAGDEAAAAEKKLASLGIKPVARKEIKKTIRMNRLFYGAYTDYDQYSAELGKLRQTVKGAFGVEKNGTYSLYAGSFAARDRVEKEKKGLAAKGIALQVQPADISLATVKLTAGMFSSKKEADKAAAKMKGAGLAAKVVSQRR